MPDWYPLIRAAKYLNVAPWDLLQQPMIWSQMALDAEIAEETARENASKRT